MNNARTRTNTAIRAPVGMHTCGAAREKLGAGADAQQVTRAAYGQEVARIDLTEANDAHSHYYMHTTQTANRRCGGVEYEQPKAAMCMQCRHW